MTKQERFSDTWLDTLRFGFILLLEFGGASAIAIWGIVSLESLMLDHKDFLIHMTDTIIRHESIWETLAWIAGGIVGFIGFAIVIGQVLRSNRRHYPEVKPEYEAGEE